MRTIWKFPIHPDSRSGQTFSILVEMPLGIKPLCVMNQDGVVCI